MRASGPSPLRRLPRPIRRALALLASAVVIATTATAISPVAVADPPPGYAGGWTETNPFHGEAADPFTITYWFVPVEGSCPFTVARFIWDFDTTIGTATMSATCSATLSVPSAPTDEVANHNVNAEGCTTPGGVLTCDGTTNAGTMYMVDPTPTISVTPTAGQAGQPLSVTYTVPDPGCFYTDTQFFWDGSPIGSPVAMSGCSSTLDLSAAPTPNAVGAHTIAAEACDGGTCESATRKTVTYTIVAPPPPTITVEPTRGLANQNFGLRYTVSQVPCPYTSAQFFWDSSPLGSPIALDSDCSAPLFEDVAPSPNGVGAHTVAAEGCDGSCDPTSRAEATYTVLAPPTLVLAPASGVVDAPFRATYHTNDGSCSPVEVRFYWDDAPVEDVLMDDTCTAAFDFVAAPTPNDLGSHTVAAETCIDGCDVRTRASAAYEIVSPPPPSLTADPTSGLPTDPFTVTYDFGRSSCSFATVEFAWDGTSVGSATMDSGCTATLSLLSAPTPATLGSHQLTARPCGTFCDDTAQASTTYTIVPPPARPTISVDPSAGLANQNLGIRFSTNQSPCPYSTVQFSWDGAALGNPVSLDATCSAVLFADVAPTPNGVGPHDVGAQACTATCDAATGATTTYTILAPPTLVLSPTSGFFDAGFTATYHIENSSCSLWQARFYWDGVAVAPDVDLGTCTAVFDFPAAPVPNDPGPHTLAADTCIDGCDDRTRATATYTVLAPRPPSLAVTPTAGPATGGFTATYDFGRPGCAFTHVAFAWDDSTIGDVPLDDSCVAILTVTSAPSPDGPGDHVLTALACEGSFCDGSSMARATYTVSRPPAAPTLTVQPAAGLGTATFSVTYRYGAADCGYPEAEFLWDGTFLGVAPLDAACTATLAVAGAPSPSGPGSHTLSAAACEDSACDGGSIARSTYTVLSPIPPSPTSSPTRTPTPTSTATPEPTPDPTAEPSTEPSLEPSPAPSVEPSPDTSSPVPSQAVAGETSPPKADGSPEPGVVVLPSPSVQNRYVPALASDIVGPSTDSIEPAVVVTNILLALLLVFLFGLTAEVFNSTMDANRAVINGWWARLLAGPLAFLGAMTFTGRSLGRLDGSGRFGSFVRVLAVLTLLGLIYGLLSPDFGLNSQSVVLVLSLMIGLGFLTYFSEGSATRLAARRYEADASIRLYGTAILVAVVAVVVSRMVTLSPGLLYGFVASAVIVAPVALSRRDDATLVLVPAFGILIISVLAWLLLGPVRVLAADGAFAPALAETVLAMIVIGGLEGVFITMIPLRFLDGSTVRSWSVVAWAITFGIAAFLWWQILLDQDAAYGQALEQTNVQAVLTVLVIFMLTTGGFWGFFRLRPQQADAKA